MLVRLVVEHRRAGVRYPAGTLLEVRDDEGMVLVQDAIAVPLRDTGVLARETR